MNFIGRKNELSRLDKFYKDNLSHCALIYGRRRIGKSELIKESMKNSGISGIYYESKQTSEKNNVESLSEILSELLNLPKLAFNSFEELLNFLFNYHSGKTFILVLDEYPYLRNVINGLDSIIQNLIDKYNEKTNFKLIICGSFNT